MNLFRDERVGHETDTYLPLFRTHVAPGEFRAGDDFSRAVNVIGGYRTAAAVIAHDLIAALRTEQTEEGRFALGQLIPPYFFLWRHHVELLIKQCLSTLERRNRQYVKGGPGEWTRRFGTALPDDLLTDALSSSHSLTQLWHALQPYAEQLWSIFGHAHTAAGFIAPNAATALLEELDAVDPRGMGTHYFADGHENTALPELPGVDVEWTHDKLNRLSNYFVSVQVDILAIHGMPQQVADRYLADPAALFVTSH